MSVYDAIAYRDGLFHTIWGPCWYGWKEPCDCPSCVHADKLAAEGKDWDEEFHRALMYGGRVSESVK